MWLSDSRHGEIVEAAWNSCAYTDLDSMVINKVNQCGKDLTWWNHNVFDNVRRELNQKKKKLLIGEENLAMRSGDNTWVRTLKLEINHCWIMKLECGSNGLEYCGWAKGMATPSTSIPEHLIASRKILLGAFIIPTMFGLKIWRKL